MSLSRRKNHSLHTPTIRLSGRRVSWLEVRRIFVLARTPKVGRMQERRVKYATEPCKSIIMASPWIGRGIFCQIREPGRCWVDCQVYCRDCVLDILILAKIHCHRINLTACCCIFFLLIRTIQHAMIRSRTFRDYPKSRTRQALEHSDPTSKEQL